MIDYKVAITINDVPNYLEITLYYRNKTGMPHKEQNHVNRI